MSDRSPCALIVGEGPGLGSGLARRFARGGLRVCVARRRGALLAPLCEQLNHRVFFARICGERACESPCLLDLF
ncbi:MAG: hypothetical protein AAFV53_37550, partial [Myxococcota bacterium]